ncbi:hypothetical protein C8A00DRAFT_18438 [Chaetomidium leptoderma]|uniref:Uncharacterized protein n=1 Tax=Chaetomidium leptoderma TaxID=669021 RepID=A0AAN6VEQ2_9PEZI|nr:hypothetical protein C8A00DRAFT_18438 [Chaetomidium leptoderma]
MAFTGRLGTLLGPLTTTWSVPDSCTVHLLTCPTCAEGFRGQQCVVRSGTGQAEDHTNCWPPATQKAGTPRYPFVGWGFYSPGLACPTGYTTACTAEHGGRSEWEVEFTMVPGETAVGCCPEGFACTNRNGNTCIAVISTDAPVQTTVATAMCSGSEMVNLAPATFPDIITTTATASSGGAIAVQTATRSMVLLAPMFQLNYQSSDISAASSSSSSSAASTTPTDRTSSSTDSASSDTTLPTPASQGGLSTGAMVGVGVGAALGGILLGILAVVLFLRKRKRTESAAAGHDRAGGPQTQPQYYAAEPVQKDAQYWIGAPPVELHQHQRVAELDDHQRPELPAESDGVHYGQGRPGI